MILNSKNINKVIKSITDSMDKADIPEHAGIIMPKYWNTGKIDRKKYKGVGRPKKTDYIFEHYKKYFKGIFDK